jgi:aerobic-type carbon monoxide dehydrogenase small subunit (CoxS/CutS family)
MPREEKKKSTEENEKDRSGGISRREFTIASMAIFGAASAGEGKAITQVANKKLAQPGVSSQATAGLPLTSSARKISLTVNKWKYEVYVEPEWILRDVLRDQLGFLSIKDMCNGYGACGSCTVIMDGRPVLSCMTFAADCDGMNIETAEGVAINHPQLIEAYVLNHCMQCGYCTPGFVVTAKALLDRIPKPTEAEIRDSLGGNICRCGTYTQHILAIKEVIGNA